MLVPAPDGAQALPTPLDDQVGPGLTGASLVVFLTPPPRTVAIFALVALLSPIHAGPARSDAANIVAYGRIVPGEGAVAITLPYFQAGPQLVAALTVKVGDKVAAGQVLALSANHDAAAASVAQAKAHADAVAAQLEVVREGAKPEDTAAQAAVLPVACMTAWSIFGPAKKPMRVTTQSSHAKSGLSWNP
jgi:multidrug efflux pump subunit AcrA (membrane-fusion protein)